jgi:hypothetical protein
VTLTIVINCYISDIGNLFQLVDSSRNYITGQQNGLLLCNGATLCGSKFNYSARYLQSNRLQGSIIMEIREKMEKSR